MSLSNHFEKHFATIEDPRKDNHNRRHKLMDMLVLTILAVISGAEDWIASVWCSFGTWLRTIRNNTLPSEMVVSISLKNSYQQFLADETKFNNFKKFLRKRMGDKQPQNEIYEFEEAA